MEYLENVSFELTNYLWIKKVRFFKWTFKNFFYAKKNDLDFKWMYAKFNENEEIDLPIPGSGAILKKIIRDFFIQFRSKAYEMNFILTSLK